MNRSTFFTAVTLSVGFASSSRAEPPRPVEKPNTIDVSTDEFDQSLEALRSELQAVRAVRQKARPALEATRNTDVVESTVLQRRQLLDALQRLATARSNTVVAQSQPMTTEPPKAAPPKTDLPAIVPPSTAPPRIELPITEPPKIPPPKIPPSKTELPKTEPPSTIELPGSPERTNEAFARGRAAFQLGDFAEAERQFRLVADTGENQWYAKYLLASSLRHQKKLPEAFVLYDEIIQQSGDATLQESARWQTANMRLQQTLDGQLQRLRKQP